MPVQPLRLRDLIYYSKLQESLGVCATDVARIAEMVNAAQERLIYAAEAGEEGWYGGYAEMAFNVDRTNPTLRLPWGCARLIAVDVCELPVPVRNQFYEYLEFGLGHWPKTLCTSSCTGTVCLFGHSEVFPRNLSATIYDLQPPRKSIRLYPSESADAPGNRVFLGGNDANDQRITTLDGPVRVRGVFTNLDHPFADVVLPLTSAPLEISYLDVIQKDQTIGTVSVYEVDMDTGAQRLLVTLQPGEEAAGYASYYLKDLPQTCCQAPGTTNTNIVQVRALVKLDLIPVQTETDPLLIQSREALLAECEAGELASKQQPAAKAQAVSRHRDAVRLLRGQMRHFVGEKNAAVIFAPFGDARLADSQIGTML